MIADTWLLLYLRWQVAWNGFRSRKAAYQAMSVLGFGLLALFGVAASSFVGVTSGFLIRRFPQEHLDTVIPGFVLTVLTVLILFSSFGVALGSLFLSSDLDLLMTAPVDRKAVFVSKILDGVVYFYALVVVLAVPALVMYGVGMAYGPLYYLLALLSLVGIPLFPAALAAILVMLVARFAPARRVREVLGLMGALFGIACGLLGQTSRFWFRDVARAGGGPETWLVTLRGWADLPIPSLVAGRGLAAAGGGDLIGASTGLASYLLLTFGFFIFCVFVADNLYAAGWVRMQSSGSAKRSRERAERQVARGGLLSRASAPLAIMLKDWRVIPRDLRNFAQLLSPLFLLPVLYLYMFDPGRNGSSALQSVTKRAHVDATGVFVAASVLLATAMVFGRIADTSISREGKSWWLLKASPLSGAEIIRGKFLTSVVPYAVVSTVLLLGAALWMHFSVAGTLYGWYGVELLGAGMLAVETGVSVPWARLDWDDPRRMSSGWGSLFTMLTWVVLGLLGGGALCLPLLAQVFDPSLVAPAFLVGMVMAALVAGGAGFAGLSFGAARMADVGES